MMARRRERRRWESGPVMASVLLHGAVAGLLAFSGGEAPEPPKTKIYAVDIVSPPPNVAGAPPTEALSNQEPGPAASPGLAPAAETPPAPEPDPAPPAPEPPAPEPDPAPPKAKPKEPAKAPEPRRTPPERPAPTPPRPSTPRPPTPAPEKNRPATPPANRPAATPEKNRPASPATGTNRPATNRPTATPEKNRPAGGSSTAGGSGTGSTRTRGDGTSTAPATGSNPQANSPGGEGLNIHQEGEPCPVAGYCERVTLQVQRFFRAPPDNAGARGEVCFRIQRDGSVTDIQAQRVRGGGGAAFRLAMMEAAEAAGSRRAFGTLPGAFDPQRWRWCVELSPR